MKTVHMNYPRLGDIRINGVYQKGKRGKEKRVHFTELSTNKEYIMWTEDHPFLHKELNYTEVTNQGSGQLKQQQYNYYLDNSINEDLFFDQMILDFVNADPMIPTSVTSMQHAYYSNGTKYPIYV